MKNLKKIYKKITASPNILPPLKIDILRQELTDDQIRAVNEVIQPLFKTPVRSLVI